MNWLIMAIATGGFVGRMAWAPGSWGSAVAFLPWLLLNNLSLPSYLVSLVVMFVVGFLTSGSAEKLLDEPGARCIVVGEILGMLIALTQVPRHPAALLLAFFLFRAFDIVKPFPVSWIHQHINGGLGMMMDDVLAGLYALLLLQILVRLWH